MAARPQKRSRITREKILAVARTLFDADGYENVSVDEIARSAGVAKGTVFVHFPDKASLLTAVRISELEELLDQTKTRVRQLEGTDALDIITDLLTPWLALFAAHRDFTRIFLNQSELRGGSSALRLYEVCLGLDTALQETVSYLISARALTRSVSVNVYTQGILAFFYHVVTGLYSGATSNSDDQKWLLRALLARWLKK